MCLVQRSNIVGPACMLRANRALEVGSAKECEAEAWKELGVPEALQEARDPEVQDLLYPRERIVPREDRRLGPHPER